MSAHSRPLRARHCLCVVFMACWCCLFARALLAQQADSHLLRVEAVHAQPVQYTPVIRASGSVAPWQTAPVSAEVAGLRVLEILADVGDRVKKGQLLARLDSSFLQLEQRGLQARAEQARVAWREAQDNARRAQRLEGSGSMAQQQIAAMLAAERSALEQLRSVEAQLEGQNLRLARSSVQAPDDGIILARQLALGQVVGAGQELFRLARQGRLEWQARLGARELAQLAPGQSVRLRLPGGASQAGTVRAIAPELNGPARQATVHVALEDGARPGALFAGMFAQGEFLLEARAGWSLPFAAVTLRDGRSLVWRLEEGEDGGGGRRACAVPVRIVAHLPDGQLVVDGLDAADAVVLRGGEFLVDGEAVRPAP